MIRDARNNRGANINLIKPRPFVFKVAFNWPAGFVAETRDLSLDGYSVIVEVEPEEFVTTASPGSSAETARYLAEETAQRAALETIQKDFPEGLEPVCLAVPIDRLPSELRRRPPTLHTYRARAWLV